MGKLLKFGRIFRSAEAAAFLGLSPRMFDQHVAAGDIPYAAIGFGRQRVSKRFDERDLEDFRRYLDRVRRGTSDHHSLRAVQTVRHRIKQVYFAKLGDYLKIGCAIDVAERLKTLAIGFPQEMELLGTEPGGADREKALHRQFADLRARGEWFRYEGALKEYVEGLRE